MSPVGRCVNLFTHLFTENGVNILWWLCHDQCSYSVVCWEKPRSMQVNEISWVWLIALLGNRLKWIKLGMINILNYHIHTTSAISQSNENGQILTTHRIRTPWPIRIKLCTTDYVHEHETLNLCQSAVRERLAKYVKYKAFLFIFPGLAYWSNPSMEFQERCLKTRVCIMNRQFGVK